MHKDNEPSFEEKVELENQMNQERIKNRVHKQFDDLAKSIKIRSSAWSDHEERYTKKCKSMLY